MYNEYRGKKEIILWFYANNKPDEGSREKNLEKLKWANYQTTAETEKTEEVGKIIKKFKENILGTIQKLRTWASSHPNGETHFLYPAT